MTTEMVYPSLQKIIDVLKNLDDSPTSQLGFDMRQPLCTRYDTIHPCGSACCIGGHAQRFVPEKISIVDALGSWCDVPHGVSADLCFPTLDCNPDVVELGWAIQVLEHCRDTGKVDWNKLTPWNIKNVEGEDSD